MEKDGEAAYGRRLAQLINAISQFTMSRGFAKYVKLKYPPTASAVLSDKLFAVGGGGGKSKSGIPNRVILTSSRNNTSQV